MPILSRKVEIRISYVATTPKGREIHDCITYPIESFMTDPNNVKIGTQKVVTDINARLSQHDTQRDAAEEAAQNQPEPTEDEKFEAIIAGVTDLPSFKAWLAERV